MKAEVEIVSPAMAKEYLERALPNRPIQDSTVSRYVRDMLEDNWQANGQPIIFTSSGELLDGRHRCTAVLRSGKSVSMLVVRNVDRRAFVTMDSGRSRSITDVLAMEGIKNPSIVAASARVAMNYIAGVRYIYPLFTRADTEDFVRKHPYIKETSILLGQHHHTKLLGLSRGAVSAIFFLGNDSQTFTTEVASFMEGIVSGAGLWKGDPRLTFRNWLLGRRASIGRVTMEEHICVTIKVWNAFAQGKELSSIRMVDKPTRELLPIVGYAPDNYHEIPDLSRLAKEEEVRSNLPKDLATPPLEFPR